MEKQGNKIIITFDNLGSGLYADSRYGYVKGFTIAGANKKFVWAKAYIEGDKVIVYNDHIEHPVAVRYNWANNPDGNLYNKERLPLCPFRTDVWEGITEK
jgi:sialate O-acetylesterase